eukprot:2535209-Rhodomonas_salina.2
MSAAAVKSATMGSKAEQPAFPSDSTENVATALLGLQGENVSTEDTVMICIVVTFVCFFGRYITGSVPMHDVLVCKELQRENASWLQWKTFRSRTSWLFARRLACRTSRWSSTGGLRRSSTSMSFGAWFQAAWTPRTTATGSLRLRCCIPLRTGAVVLEIARKDPEHGGCFFRVLQLAIDHLKAVLSGQATATPTIKEENAEKDEAARLSEEDTASEQLMFEMDGVDGRKLRYVNRVWPSDKKSNVTMIAMWRLLCRSALPLSCSALPATQLPDILLILLFQPQRGRAEAAIAGKAPVRRAAITAAQRRKVRQKHRPSLLHPHPEAGLCLVSFLPPSVLLLAGCLLSPMIL